MAVRAVNRELVSAVASLIYRENTGKSPNPVIRAWADPPFQAPSWPYGVYFPEFGNREISADEQGISRRELRKLLVIAEK